MEHCRRGGLQEAEDVELVDVFDTGVGECEDGPGELEECNIKRGVDLFPPLSVQTKHDSGSPRDLPS